MTSPRSRGLNGVVDAAEDLETVLHGLWRSRSIRPNSLPLSSSEGGQGWGVPQGVVPSRVPARRAALLPRQRPFSAPPLQPSPSTWLLSRLYAPGDGGVRGSGGQLPPDDPPVRHARHLGRGGPPELQRHVASASGLWRSAVGHLGGPPGRSLVVNLSWTRRRTRGRVQAGGPGPHPPWDLFFPCSLERRSFRA